MSAPADLMERAEAARAAAARVADPELPFLTIGELGVLHGVDWDERGHPTVTILPTYSGCPAIRVIALEVETELVKAGFSDARVVIANAPVWTTDRMSESAREKLRAFGVSPPERKAGKQPLFAAASRVACPRCGSQDTERISEFGSTACKGLWRCHACREPFEHFKCV